MSQLLRSVLSLQGACATLLALGVVTVAQAQPGNNSPNQFGDRQSGQWGDPGQGYFGNPSVGEFDRAQIKPPPPGARPMGRVTNGRAPVSPYISLPTPADAAPEAAKPAKPAKAAKPPAATKKPAE